MLIDLDIIITYGGTQKKYKKGELIFKEGDQSRYFYQVVEGSVKMFNMNLDGKQYTQGIFHHGESFAEPPLFINKTYPSSAEAVENSIIMRLKKDIFLNLLEEIPDLQKKIFTLLANRVYSKALASKILVNSDSETRILSFLDYYKSKSSLEQGKIKISLTRQQIADHTGMRVETAIRALTKLNILGKVEIINRKLFY